MDENYGGRLSFTFVYPPDKDIKRKKCGNIGFKKNKNITPQGACEGRKDRL